MNTTKANRNIGIDVGKSFLDIFILELDRHWQIHNTREDIRDLVKQLKRFNLTRICLLYTSPSPRDA